MQPFDSLSMEKKFLLVSEMLGKVILLTFFHFLIHYPYIYTFAIQKIIFETFCTRLLLILWKKCSIYPVRKVLAAKTVFLLPYEFIWKTSCWLDLQSNKTLGPFQMQLIQIYLLELYYSQIRSSRCRLTNQPFRLRLWLVLMLWQEPSLRLKTLYVFFGRY